jgi:nucleotide-binding universal stress UspA family protein
MESLIPKLILVPTDFSEPAAHALRYASALGERFGAHLLVIYADAFIPPVDFMTSASGSFDLARDSMIEEAREELEGHAQRNVRTSAPYDTRISVGEPIDVITELARECGASLIVMGTRGRSGVARLLLGSVTEAVMRIAPVPVIGVNPSTPDNAGVSRILCPVQFSAACRVALRQAAALGDDEEVPILLFHGLEGKELQPSIHELIRLQEWAPRELAARCELKTSEEPAPVEEILDLALATATDLIAMGIPSDRSIAESIRGSVSERVLRESRCPVLTVNFFAARAQALGTFVTDFVTA